MRHVFSFSCCLATDSPNQGAIGAPNRCIQALQAQLQRAGQPIGVRERRGEEKRASETRDGSPKAHLSKFGLAGDGEMLDLPLEQL